MDTGGTVKWFDTKKGYGFIAPDGGGSDVFVHYGDIADEDHRALDPGQRVRFEVGGTPYGRRAMRVKAEFETDSRTK